jgi:hypothetical protein
MRFVSDLLEATIALVFIFGVVGALLTGSRKANILARRSSGLAEAHAWPEEF